jgi:hypothetical protein
MERTRRHRFFRTRRVLRAACLWLPTLVSVLPFASARADDPAVSATAGFEYFAGPDQRTRTATGEIEAKMLGGSAAVSAGRVDDEGTGGGLDLGVTLGLPIAPKTQLKVETERVRADSSYAAWALKAGPEFELDGHTLSLKYVRLEDNRSGVTNGASAELERPLIPDHLSAEGTLAYTKLQDLAGTEGSAGLSWTPVEHLEIEGEAGYTRTGISLNGLFSSKHVARSSGLKKQSQGPVKTPGMTAQVAMRFSFP